MGISGALGASAVGQVAGSYLGAKSRKKGMRRADAVLSEAEGRFEPYTRVGTEALDRLAHSMGLADSSGVRPDGRDFSEFFKSPGYQFRLDEGLKAVENSAAARGILQSGGTLKGIDEYAEGLASQEYGRYTDRLFQLSEQGRGAAGTMANIATNRANIAAGIGDVNANMWEGLGDTVSQTAQGSAVLQGYGKGAGATPSGRIDVSPSAVRNLPILPGGF